MLGDVQYGCGSAPIAALLAPVRLSKERRPSADCVRKTGAVSRPSELLCDDSEGRLCFGSADVTAFAAASCAPALLSLHVAPDVRRSYALPQGPSPTEKQ